MMNKKVFTQKIFFTLFAVHFMTASSALAAFWSIKKPVDCGLALQNIVSPKADYKEGQKIESFDDLMKAFSNGFVPDLKNKAQKDAFEIYRRMRFGDPNTNIPANAIEAINKELQQHPELKKESFRNYDLEVQEKIYPVTPELKSFIDGQLKSAGQVRSNLFQIDANLGYWKKILQYEDAHGGKSSAENQNKEEAKQVKKLEGERFLSFLNKIISPETRVTLADASINAKGRARILFPALTQAREKLKAQGKDIRPISQAIVDLIHTIGFHEPSVQKDLKSNNGMDRINAFRRILSERDSFAMELGFKNHFEEAEKFFGVILPTGIESLQMLSVVFPKIQKDVESKAQVATNSASTRSIRHLSIVESPFRSCLGGSDCSSRTYLTRALDPNYHYFTMTDFQGYSTGHFTVVVGEATAQHKNGSQEKVKMAFIDKIQNVPNNDIPLMMEGIRRSLLEKGYTLALPVDIGDHNGLSNEEVTRSFVKQNIKTDADTKLVNFKPHSHKYNFPNQYSRADQGLPARAVLPIKDDTTVSFNPGAVNDSWKHSGFDLNTLVQASYSLKNGNTEDKLRYLPSMKAIQVAGLKVDPEFNQVLQKWLGDEHESIQLRRQILLHQWKEENKSLPELLNSFSKSDQVGILQNLLDTPRYRDVLLKQKKDLGGLLIRARTNKKVRDTLATQLYPRYVSQIEKILDAPDIDDAKAKLVIESMEKGYEASDLEEVSKFPSLLRGTSLEVWVQEDLPNHYLKNVMSEGVFARQLSKGITSQDEGTRQFSALLITKALHDSRLKEFKVVQAFAEIGSRYGWDSLAWLNANSSIELKAEFIFAHYFSRPELFKDYMQNLKSGEKAEIEKYISSRTSFGVFEKFAKEQRIPEKVVKMARAESFDFTKLTFPKEGKKFSMGSPSNESGRYNYEFSEREVIITKPFEIAATPVTQLQWFMVMGGNPSKFNRAVNADGSYIDFAGGMNINHPVEQVSWNDIQQFIQKLNEKSDKYVYRLPTEAEWELAARAGTTTAYSYGDNPQELDEHGWYSGNSNGRTHAVAEKKPNALGLYDMHGNVWEWMQDYWADPNNSPAIDPRGPTTGSFRVIRGGSWYYFAQFLRSASRVNFSPVNRYSYIGFRLVRTLKK